MKTFPIVFRDFKLIFIINKDSEDDRLQIGDFNCSYFGDN